MPTDADATTSLDTRSLVTTRTIDALPGDVWRACTEPSRLEAWWTPRGLTTTSRSMELRVGGLWQYELRVADGRVFNEFISWRVLEPERRLTWVHGVNAGETADFESTLTLAPRREGSQVTLRLAFPTVEALELHVARAGFAEAARNTLARLDAHVARH